MKYNNLKKDSLRSFPIHKAGNPKISLFCKPTMWKAPFVALMLLLLISSPFRAHAGFLSFVGDLIGGNNDSAPPVVQDAPKNSQTVQLLEPSLTPDLKNQGGKAGVSIVDDQALEGKVGPMGTEADLDNIAYTSTSKFGVHIVKAGETLASIAKKEKVSIYSIVYANSDIKKADLTKVGTVLTIIPLDGTAYTVKKGETAESVAKKYGLSVADIIEYNLLKKASDVDAGETIFLVGVSTNEIKTADAKEKQAKAFAVANTNSKQNKTKVDDTPEPVVVKPVEKPVDVAPVVVEQPASSPETAPQDVPQGPSGKIANGFIWPFPEDVGRVTQRLHGPNGVDLAAKKGTPIFAVADGTILIADDQGWNGGYGYYVVENFTDSTQGMYAHMSKVVTEAGQTVKQGDLIGYVGSTGHSTGPHLHFERRGASNPFKDLKVNSTSEDFHD